MLSSLDLSPSLSYPPPLAAWIGGLQADVTTSGSTDTINKGTTSYIYLKNQSIPHKTFFMSNFKQISSASQATWHPLSPSHLVLPQEDSY